MKYQFYTIGTEVGEKMTEVYGVAYHIKNEVCWIYECNEGKLYIEEGMVELKSFLPQLIQHITHTGLVEYSDERAEEASHLLFENELKRMTLKGESW
jgi:hypothetical protein